MHLKSVCPQCSAVVSVKKLRCDYGHEFPYKRKVQIPDDGKDTIYAVSMSKRAKRASESHEQIVTRQKRNMERMASLRSSETHEQTLQRQADNRKRMAGLRASVQRRSVSVNSPISTFHSVVKLGPDFVSTCCHRMMYRKIVVLCNKAHYTILDVNLFNNVFSADISYVSYDGKEWVCKTCDRALKRGNMPLHTKANGLWLSQVPPELSNLKALELRMICLRLPFMKMVALPSGKQRSIHGPAVNPPTLRLY